MDNIEKMDSADRNTDVGLDQQAKSLIEKSANLSDIISGANDDEPKPLVWKNERETQFFAHDTPKVSDILENVTNENWAHSRFKPEEKEKMRKILAESISGKIVIDLGAGYLADGIKLSLEFDASGYIAVEPFFTSDIKERLPKSIKNFFQDYNTNNSQPQNVLERFKIHISSSDILSFLKRLPSNLPNAVFLVSGIDEFIFGSSPYEENEKAERGNEYIQEIAKELKRVLPQGGRLINYASVIGLYGEDSEEIIFNDKLPEHSFFVQQKK